jgi:hypothetical protein
MSREAPDESDSAKANSGANWSSIVGCVTVSDVREAGAAFCGATWMQWLMASRRGAAFHTVEVASGCTDDARTLITNGELAADRVPITAELALPEAIADDGTANASEGLTSSRKSKRPIAGCAPSVWKYSSSTNTVAIEHMLGAASHLSSSLHLQGAS